MRTLSKTAIRRLRVGDILIVLRIRGGRLAEVARLRRRMMKRKQR